MLDPRGIREVSDCDVKGTPIAGRNVIERLHQTHQTHQQHLALAVGTRQASAIHMQVFVGTFLQPGAPFVGGREWLMGVRFTFALVLLCGFDGDPGAGQLARGGLHHGTIQERAGEGGQTQHVCLERRGLRVSPHACAVARELMAQRSPMAGWRPLAASVC